VLLVAVTIATLAVIVEIALPTLGLAGAIALAASVLAIAGIGEQDATWWPLLGPVLAMIVWVAMIAMRRRTPVGELAAAAAFAAGGLGFAIANEDLASLLVTAAATALMALGFPRVHDAAVRLMQRPSDVGMEAFVGRFAVVDRWQGTAGVVVLDGTRWTAAAALPLPLAAGQVVTIVGTHGSTLAVADTSTAGQWPAPRTPPL